MAIKPNKQEKNQYKLLSLMREQFEQSLKNKDLYPPDISLTFNHITILYLKKLCHLYLHYFKTEEVPPTDIVETIISNMKVIYLSSKLPVKVKQQIEVFINKTNKENALKLNWTITHLGIDEFYLDVISMMLAQISSGSHRKITY